MSLPTRTVRHFIAGRWTGDPEVERRNPARHDDVVALTAHGDTDTVAEAVEAAKRASVEWAGRTAPERGRVLAAAGALLHERQDAIAHDLTREEGKTLAEAHAEVRRAADLLTFFGGEGWRLAGDVHPASQSGVHTYTRKEPLGVVGIITPWNFPIAIPAWKIAPALVAGNSVVLKPANLTPVSATNLVQALADAGLPRGVLNVVHGPGSVVGSEIVDHRDIAAVSFTGSTAVGLGIHAKASSRRARVLLEMGGKNALVVLDDADPHVAARIAAAGGFGATGQACTATSRLVCTPSIMGPVVDALVAETRRYAPGDGLQPGVRMGPVVSENQLASNQAYIEVAREEGGELLTGSEPASGLLQSPVIVRGVRPEHRVAREEIFGPVVSVMSADDLEEAIAITNDTPFGLTAGIVTNDLRATHHFVGAVQAGVVKVNRPTTGLELNMPFGGVKGSSSNTFREQGAGAVDFYTWVKSVYLGHG